MNRFCQRDIQRIGLSATVGDPAAILDWLQGSSSRPGVIVDPPRPLSRADVALDYVQSIEKAANRRT